VDATDSTPTCRFTPPKESPPRPITRRFTLNVVCLIVLGVGLLWWLGHFTDSFAEAAAVLSLGGALSWLAVMLRVIPDEAKKAGQSGLFGFLGTPLLTRLVAAAALLLLLLSLCARPLELTLAEGVSDRPVWFDAPASADPHWLSKGKPVRYVFWAWPFQPRSVRIKISGYPSKQEAVTPWHLPKVRAPQHFVRRVLVLRPTREFAEIHAFERMKATIEVTTEGAVATYPALLGERAVWVGCDEDVEVPDAVREEWAYAWRSDYDAARQAFDQRPPPTDPRAARPTPPELREDRLKLFWLRPEALKTEGNSAAPDELHRKAVVRITLAPRSGIKQEPLVVPDWAGLSEFPQVVDIREP
jgi:hypothetical protein